MAAQKKYEIFMNFNSRCDRQFSLHASVEYPFWS